jgi:sugar lactone lactonase YvrE
MRKMIRAFALCAVGAVVAPGAAAAKPERPLALESIATLTGQLPESITTDDRGNLYFSSATASRVIKRSPDGQLSTFGILPIAGINALGVKVGPDGCVYNVSNSLSATPGAYVWRICGPEDVTQFAALDQAGSPNDLAFDDFGNLYVTDAFLGRIYKISRRGEVTIWLENSLFDGDPAAPALLFHALGIDGIAFDRNQRNLYVCNLDFGTILRVEVRNGVPGDVSVFASDTKLIGADGLAFDDTGTLFVAVNAQDTIVSVDDRGRIETLAEGGLLDGPSSIVFGATHADRKTMYVTSSAFLHTFGLEPGTPAPAILEAPVRHGGQPLL